MQTPKTPPAAAPHIPQPGAQAAPAAASQSHLFHPRLPSAIKVTDLDQAKQLLQGKMKEGFRWVAPGFIRDAKYNVNEIAEVPTSPEHFGAFDVLIVNTPFVDDNGKNKKRAYYVNENNNIAEMIVPATWTKSNLKQYLDTKHDYSFLIKTKNPVAKARQMPDIAEGDWVAMEGKTMRLIKASDLICQSLEVEFVTAKTAVMNIDGTGGHSAQLPSVSLPEGFFPDSYARVAGAYTRRLERHQHLPAVFNRFFSVREFDSSDPTKKHSKVNSLSVALFGRADTKYTKFQMATLKPDPLTSDDITLIKKGLGITIDPAVLSKTPPPTIAEVVPFKKVLEALTYYNPQSGIPMLTSFKIGASNAQFLLSSDDKQPTQLIVSGYSSELNGDFKFEGHAYPWWMNNYYNSGSPVSAQRANTILHNPLSATTSIDQKTLEFLACTQIVESHFTPGQLESSRVPGSGKLARAVVKRHATSTPPTPLSSSFDAKEKTPYPMAATAGTGNTRNAVSELTRNAQFALYGGGTRGQHNAHAYDMSDDSDVES